MTTTSLDQPTYTDYRHALAYVNGALLVTGIDPRALAYGDLMDTVTDTTLDPLCDLWQHEHLVTAIGDALDVPRDTRDYSAAVMAATLDVLRFDLANHFLTLSNN